MGTTTRNEQIREDTITGASINDKIGIYDETNSYSTGDSVLWNGGVYVTTTDITAGTKGDMSNTPDVSGDWYQSIKLGKHLDLSENGNIINSSISHGGIYMTTGIYGETLPLFIISNTTHTDHPLLTSTDLGNISNHTFMGIMQKDGVEIVGIGNINGITLRTYSKLDSSSVGFEFNASSHDGNNDTVLPMDANSTLFAFNNLTYASIEGKSNGSILTSIGANNPNKDNISGGGLSLHQGSDTEAIFLLSNDDIDHGLTSSSLLGDINTHTFFGLKKLSDLGGACLVGIAENTTDMTVGVSLSSVVSGDTTNNNHFAFILKGNSHNGTDTIGSMSNDDTLVLITNDNDNIMYIMGDGRTTIAHDGCTLHSKENGYNVTGGGLSLNQYTSSSGSSILLLASEDITTPITTGTTLGNISDGTYGGLTTYSSGQGGLQVVGINNNSLPGVLLTSYIKDGSTSYGVIKLNGMIYDTSDSNNIKALPNGDILLEINNDHSKRMIIQGNGSILTTYSGTIINQNNISDGGLVLFQSDGSNSKPITILSANDMNHPLTTSTGVTIDAKTYSYITTASGVSSGGLKINAIRSYEGEAIILNGYSKNGSASVGVVVVNANQYDSSDSNNIKLIDPSHHLFDVRNMNSNRFYITGDGHIYAKYSTVSTFDVEDDLALLEATKFMMGDEVEYRENDDTKLDLNPDDYQIPKNFKNKKISNKHIKRVKELGIINDDGFVDTQQHNALTYGTITQMYNIIKVLGEKLGFTEDDLKKIAMETNGSI